MAAEILAPKCSSNLICKIQREKHWKESRMLWMPHNLNLRRERATCMQINSPKKVVDSRSLWQEAVRDFISTEARNVISQEQPQEERRRVGKITCLFLSISFIIFFLILGEEKTFCLLLFWGCSLESSSPSYSYSWDTLCSSYAINLSSNFSLHVIYIFRDEEISEGREQ